MNMSIFGSIFLILYYILQIYYLMLVIYIILTWIPPLRNSKIFEFFSKITYPFVKVFSQKIIVGAFDVGFLLGMIFYEVGLNALLYLAASL